MGANIAGIYGAQIFRRDDRPLYRRAFSVACAVLALGIALAVFRYLDDLRRRRREARRKSDVQPEDGRDGDHKWRNVSSAPPSPPNGGVMHVVVGADSPGVSRDSKS